MEKHIIIYGNLSDGFTHIGPFDTAEATYEYINKYEEFWQDEYQIATLVDSIEFETAFDHNVRGNI